MNKLDPNKTICVVKHKGREVGRIPATAKAEAYITELARHYGDVEVEYVEDESVSKIDTIARRRVES